MYRPKTKRKVLELLSFWYKEDIGKLAKMGYEQLYAIYYRKQRRGL